MKFWGFFDRSFIDHTHAKFDGQGSTGSGFMMGGPFGPR